MRKHPIRKFLGLTVLYSVLIIGIFVIQFKSESVISKNIGDLRISLAQTESDSNTTKLKNQLRATFNGLTLSTNNESPATLTTKSGKTTMKLVLESWNQPTENSAQFIFNGHASLTLEVVPSGDTSTLIIRTEMPEGWDYFTIPYNTNGSYSVKEKTENKLLISSKNSNWSLTAPLISQKEISVTDSYFPSIFQFFNPTNRYDCSTAITNDGSNSRNYDANVRMIRDALVRTGQEALNSSQAYSLSEYEIIAYVAEMAKNGRYDTAINQVPDNFKKGNRRTYVSAPYFDNLVNMNKSLVIQTDRYRQMVDSALESRDLNIFAVDGISDYILREKFTSKIQNLLSFPGNNQFEPNLSQATAILNVWTTLRKKDSNLAGLIEKTVPKCLEVIAENCSYSKHSLNLQQTDDHSGLTNVIKTGQSLINAGTVLERQDLIQSGQLLINTRLSSETKLDIHALAAIYPILVADNPYYPHTQIFGYYGTVPVWAWTCANKATYKIKSSGTVDINIDFPQGWTHYMLFNGVPTFHANIEIQKQKFRTDPRFENYNSSGYVYHSDTQTLFLKSRHKSQNELIRLFCDKTTKFRDSDTKIGEESKATEE